MKEEVLISVKGSKFKVLRPKGQYSYIEFIDTGYVCRAKNSLIQKGIVYDPTEFINKMNEWEPYEREFINNKGQKFKSFAKKGKKIKIVFPDTNFVNEVFIDNALAGKTLDPTAVSLYGMGSIGVPDKSLPYYNKAKQLWNNMIKRCYFEKDKKGYFGKAFVDSRWLVFENFLNDISKLDGFDGWVSGSETGLRFNLDKDFYMKGNNTYSRYACCFLPESFNKALGRLGK